MFDYSYSPNDTRIAHMRADENKQVGMHCITSKTAVKISQNCLEQELNVRSIASGMPANGFMVFYAICESNLYNYSYSMPEMC